jgi:hypothetical protein
MAAIIDPIVITYCNQVIRPIADRLVGLNATIDVEASRYFATISPLISGNANGDLISDGSGGVDGDGRTQLTKADLVNFVTQMLALQTQWDGGGVFDIISKPHVNVILP